MNIDGYYHHDKLSAFLIKSRDWERRLTNIPGIFLLKLPSSRSRQASIAIESIPVDAAGTATKKRGIVIRSTSELDRFLSQDSFFDRSVDLQADLLAN